MNDTFFFILMLSGIFLIAGMVKGVTGMGLPTVAMGLLGLIMPPVAAATLLILPSLITNIWQLFSGESTLKLFRRLGIMMLGIVLGTLLGSPLLIYIDPRWSCSILGLALIAYAGYTLVSPVLSVTQRGERWVSPIIGLITGVITGATGVFVIPAVPYLNSLHLSKDELVQALGLSFTVSTLALAAGLFTHNVYRVDQLGWSGWAIIPALAGMWCGQRLRARISPQRFKQCFLIFLIVLGAEMLIEKILFR